MKRGVAVKGKGEGERSDKETEESKNERSLQSRVSTSRVQLKYCTR